MSRTMACNSILPPSSTGFRLTSAGKVVPSKRPVHPLEKLRLPGEGGGDFFTRGLGRGPPVRLDGRGEIVDGAADDLVARLAVEQLQRADVAVDEAVAIADENRVAGVLEERAEFLFAFLQGFLRQLALDGDAHHVHRPLDELQLGGSGVAGFTVVNGEGAEDFPVVVVDRGGPAGVQSVLCRQRRGSRPTAGRWRCPRR